jgi:archaellum component FlaC
MENYNFSPPSEEDRKTILAVLQRIDERLTKIENVLDQIEDRRENGSVFTGEHRGTIPRARVIRLTENRF